MQPCWRYVNGQAKMTDVARLHDKVAFHATWKMQDEKAVPRFLVIDGNAFRPSSTLRNGGQKAQYSVLYFTNASISLVFASSGPYRL